MKRFSWVTWIRCGFVIALAIGVCVGTIYAAATYYAPDGFAGNRGLVIGNGVSSATNAPQNAVEFEDAGAWITFDGTGYIGNTGSDMVDIWTGTGPLNVRSGTGEVNVFTRDNQICVNAFASVGNECLAGSTVTTMSIRMTGGCGAAGEVDLNTGGAEITSRDTVTSLTAKDAGDTTVASVSALYSDGDGEIDLVTQNSAVHLDTDGDIALATDNVSLTIAEDALWWNECIYLETPSTFLLDMTGEDGNGGLILASQRAGLGVADSGGTEGTDGEVYIATPKSSIYLDPSGNVVVQLGAPQWPQMGSSGAQTAMVGQGTAVAAGAPAQLQRAQSYLQGTAAAAQTTQAAFDNAAWLRTISTVPPLSDKDLHPEQYYH